MEIPYWKTGWNRILRVNWFVDRIPLLPLCVCSLFPPWQKPLHLKGLLLSPCGPMPSSGSCSAPLHCLLLLSVLLLLSSDRVAKQSSCRENRADIEELGERGSNQPDQALLQVGTSNPEVVSCATKTWDWQVCLTPSDRSLLMFLLSFSVLCISEDKEPRPIYASIFMYIVHVYRSIRCFGKIWRWFLI